MKLKTITTFLMLMFASLLFANEVNSFVAVSADGDKTSYALADIKRIDVNTTATSASMTVVLNDGAEEGTYSKLLFAKDITSIEEVGEVAVFVFPNPVLNTLNIQGVEENTPLEVYNLTGKLVLKDKGTEIDVTSLNQGTYILRINNQYVKFIKK